MTRQIGKLSGVDSVHIVHADELLGFATRILSAVGCDDECAQVVARHLVEANLADVDSHGVVRLKQYTRQIQSGYIFPNRKPELKTGASGAAMVDGNRGFGMPALNLAVTHGVVMARQTGVAVIGVNNSCHTGRLGEFVERGAEANCLSICLGGGGRKAWRQVAPHGGRKGLLPTNPYALGIPGGDRGPIVLDFATSAIAGGWVMAAKSAGARLPEDSVIDSHGNPTTDPDDYINGGALLPFAGPKGYGLGLFAELVGGAMLAPVTTEMNWLMLFVDLGRFQDAGVYAPIAEEILNEARRCPPARGHACVEVPGERERDITAARRKSGIPIPSRTWAELSALAAELGVQ